VPDLVNHLGHWIKSFVDFPGHAAEQLPNELSKVLKGINEWVDSILPRIEAKGRDMAAAMLKGLGGLAGNIIGGIGGVFGIGGGGSGGGGNDHPGQWTDGHGHWFNNAPTAMSNFALPSSMTQGTNTTNAPVINVNVAGSIMTARGMAEDVRTELLRMQRQGINLGFVAT
jgi:hypothetical protein